MATRDIFEGSVARRKKTCAIYAILNNANQKMYIGGTRCMSQRVNVHKHELLRGIHHAPELQKDFNEGNAQLEVITLENISDISTMKQREAFWISFYKSFGPSGYNLSPSGYGLGYKQTKEHIENMAKTKRGVKIVDRGQSWRDKISKSKSLKPIIQMDLEGNEISRFDSVSQAARFLGVGSGSGDFSITQALRGNQKTARGFTWKYV